MNTTELTSCIDAVLDVLEAEARALDRLDLAAIDACREKKLHLDERLRAALAALSPVEAPEDRADLLARLRTIRDRARRNQMRLEAVHSAIKGLLDHLTGRTGSGTYGPPRRVGARAAGPVLASAVE